MANVLIVGFEAREASAIREMVDDILAKIKESYDSSTTIIPAEARFHRKIPSGERGGRKNAAYIWVRNTKLSRAKRIAVALQKGLNLDVEYDQIGGFIPAEK